MILRALYEKSKIRAKENRGISRIKQDKYEMKMRYMLAQKQKISYNYLIKKCGRMSMKTIYMVFNNKEKLSVSVELYRNLKEVFEDHIKVKTCFLDEVSPEDISDGDLFIVLYEDRVFAMKDYISSLDRVVVLSRTIQKQFLPDIFSIPEGTDVLVVNDSAESTRQTISNLYGLGLSHVNLIPYMPEEDISAYREVKIAITPNEVLLVPSFIEKIINIQERCIDLNTFITIINKLDLNNEQITRNLLRYTQLIAENNKGINQRYVTEHLKSEMLKKIIHDSQNAILITDCDYRTVYVNDRAQTLFDAGDRSGAALEQIFGDGAGILEGDEEEENLLFSRGGTNYMVAKSTIKVVDQTVGYSFVFNDERQIKNIESDLSRKLAKRGLIAKYSFDDILYHSASMKKAISIAKKAALTDYTVLINGESGTGKELFAQSIHNYSDRKEKPFVAINCAALPESLLESELFGYEKGAFTGASSGGKLGLFEQANKGTIFLDEIGDMSLHLQVRLLRVLQEKQIMRLGSDKIIDVDIRIIAATNKNLREAIERKDFREDLYYRLSNIPVFLPALRLREEDVLYLMEDFLGKNYGRLTAEERQALSDYQWPGNVRELRNAADYYLLLGELPESILKADSSDSDEYGDQKDPDAPEDEKVCTAEARQPRREVSDLKQQILEIIRDHTERDSGIGRTSILWELRQQGTRISDDKARKLLHRLEEEGLIEIGKGRRGCRAV